MINVSPVTLSEPKFPAAYECILTGGDKGLVVLFTGSDTGLVLVSSRIRQVGEHNSSWSPCTRVEMWKPVNVTINH